MHGTLDDMCSAEEASRRTARRDIHPMELDADGMPTLCVKQYSRSAAGRYYQPHEIRTLSCCAATRAHLLTLVDTHIISVAPTPPSDKMWRFILDRYLQLRIDLHVQHAEDDDEDTKDLVAAHCMATEEHLFIALLAAALGGHHVLARHYITGILSALRDINHSSTRSSSTLQRYVALASDSRKDELRMLAEAGNLVHFMRCVRGLEHDAGAMVALSSLLVEIRHAILCRLVGALRLVERRRVSFFEEILCLPTGRGAQYLADCGLVVEEAVDAESECARGTPAGEPISDGAASAAVVVVLTPGQHVSLDEMRRVGEPLVNAQAIRPIIDLLRERVGSV
eukprot:GEMP01069067.1.p1 GENE.GEMP01069067.1~~GEMP01069067.1.p1  ORF type:complete len:349 (+),score=98.67 GEMP01069067.1:31-1047(+)